eukprot:10268-Heterococcus_DN1.PRE.1
MNIVINGIITSFVMYAALAFCSLVKTISFCSGLMFLSAFSLSRNVFAACSLSSTLSTSAPTTIRSPAHYQQWHYKMLCSYERRGIDKSTELYHSATNSNYLSTAMQPSTLLITRLRLPLLLRTNESTPQQC